LFIKLSVTFIIFAIVCTNLDKDFLEIAGKYGLKDGTTLLVAVV